MTCKDSHLYRNIPCIYFLCRTDLAMVFHIHHTLIPLALPSSFFNSSFTEIILGGTLLLTVTVVGAKSLNIHRETTFGAFLFIGHLFYLLSTTLLITSSIASLLLPKAHQQKSVCYKHQIFCTLQSL